MAAREDESEPVVRNGGGIDLIFHVSEWVGHRIEVGEKCGLGSEGLLASNSVDGLVTRTSEDPAEGVVRDSVARPPFERDEPGLLKRVLGEIEIADDANQGCGRPARLIAEDPGSLT